MMYKASGVNSFGSRLVCLDTKEFENVYETECLISVSLNKALDPRISLL